MQSIVACFVLLEEYHYISEGIKELVGIDCQEAITQTKRLLKLIHPEDRTQFYLNKRTFKQILQPFPLKYRVITQSGKIKWIRDSSRYFPSGTDGDVIVDGVILDISDVYDELYLRKQAESALRENQRLLQQIADTTLTMIYIFDLCEQRDEKLLHFILTNLLSNAIKCSPEGGEVNLTLIYQENETIFSSPKLWNWHSSRVSATAF